MFGNITVTQQQQLNNITFVKKTPAFAGVFLSFFIVIMKVYLLNLPFERDSQMIL